MIHPACFGSPVAVSHLCETCRGCAANVLCLDQAVELVESFKDSPLMQRERQRMSLSRQAFTSVPCAAGEGRVSTGKRIALSREQEKIVAMLGKSVGSQVRQLFERGWFEFARKELRAMRNPGRKEWQRILCTALMGGGVSRASLQLSYEQGLKLTPGSARVAVSKAVSIFLTGRLISEIGGKLVISPN